MDIHLFIKGKEYAIEQIFPYHFYLTAKAVGFEQEQMEQIIGEFTDNLEAVISRVARSYQIHFPPRLRIPS